MLWRLAETCRPTRCAQAALHRWLTSWLSAVVVVVVVVVVAVVAVVVVVASAASVAVARAMLSSRCSAWRGHSLSH